MPLPQQVIDRLTHDTPKTPGWSGGVIVFSVVLLVIMLGIYFGITLGYEPYVNNQISAANTQINSVALSVSTADQSNILSFYSEIANVRSAITNHVLFSDFLKWLEGHTEANVYFSRLTFSSGNQISLSGNAASEADVNQQLAIFESAPEVTKVTISSVALAQGNNTWQFSAVLTMNQSLVFRPGTATTTPATTTTP